MSHHLLRRGAIKAAAIAAWPGTKVAFGRPENPWQILPRTIVALGEVKRGGGPMRGLHQVWEFTIFGLFEKPAITDADDYEAFQVARIEELVQELAPFTEDETIPPSPPPLGGVGFLTEVTEWEAMDTKDDESFLVVRLTLRTTTEVAR